MIEDQRDFEEIITHNAPTWLRVLLNNIEDDLYQNFQDRYFFMGIVQFERMFGNYENYPVLLSGTHMPD